MATTTTSILNTPQAGDDDYSYLESDVVANDSILVLDVMSNDSGGKSKTLYSIEASEEFIDALKVQDATGEAYAQYFDGVKVWIEGGMIMVDVSGADALAELGAQSIEDLDAGQQLNLSFAYTIRLGNGTLSVATVSLTITGEGSSQVTTIGGDTARALVEADAALSTGGVLTLDAAPGVAFVAQTVVHTDAAPHYGTFTIDPYGNWAYATTDAMDGLAAGQTATDTFTVQASDGTTQDVTITITGTDDAPQVTEADIVAEFTEPASPTPEILTATGAFTLVDPDLEQDITFGNIEYPPGAIGNLTVEQTTDGATRTFTWTYSVDASAIEGLGLGQGETTSLTFTVPLLNTNDEKLPGLPISITFNGTNSVPTIQTSVPDFNLVDGFSGSISEDASASLTWMAVLDDPDGADESVFASTGPQEGHYGTFSYDESIDAWKYVVDSRAQSLVAGEEGHEIDFIATSADGTLQFPIHVTVTGVNDAPEVLSASTTGALSEDATDATAGFLEFRDVDHGDTATVSVSAGDLTTTVVPSSSDPNVYQSALGWLMLTTSEGHVGWSYQVNNDAVQSMRAGETAVETFKVTITDASGATAERSITITIEGANDDPRLNPDATTTDENQALTFDVLANDTTVDHGDFLTLVSAAVGPDLGTVTVVDNKVAFDPGTAFDRLAAGQSENVEVTYTVQNTSGVQSSSTLTVTVTGTGTDDGPIAAADTGHGDENTTITIDVLANDRTPDRIAPLSLVSAFVPQGQGSVSIVNQQLVFDPGTDFDHLAANDQATVTINYTVADEHGATAVGTATVTLTGTNDAPEAHDDYATTGATQSLAIDVLANDTDPDDGDVLTLVGSPTALYGTVSIDLATRQLVYTPSADFANLEPGQFVDDRVDYTIQDKDGAISQASVTVRVVSESTDQPIGDITGVDRGAIFATVDEATTGSISPFYGTITFTDPDIDSIQHYSVAAVGSDYGTLTATIIVDANDPTLRTITWSFTADTAKIEALGLNANDLEHLVTDEFGDPLPVGYITLDNDLPGGISNIALLLKVNGADDGQTVGINSPPLMATDVEAFDVTGVFNGSLSEDATAPLSWGALLVDPDGAAESTFRVTGFEQGLYGTFSYDQANAVWHYTLDPNAQSLVTGQSALESYQAVSMDGQLSFDINVQVIGVDDPATITPAVTGADTGFVEEDGNLVASGKLDIVDPDAGQAQFQMPVSLAGVYGNFTFDTSSGAWGYTLRNGDANVQALAGGEPAKDTLSVMSADATATHLITVNITGASELPPPVLYTTTAHIAAGWSIANVGGDLSTDNFTAGPTLFTVPTTLQGTYGSFEFQADGSWRYTLDNESAAVQSLLQAFPSDPSQAQDRLVVTSADGSVAEEIVVSIHTVAELGGGTVDGTPDNDVLYSNGGITILSGDAGDDFLGSSDDGMAIPGTTYTLLDGGAGNDALQGAGATQDVFSFSTELNASTNIDVVTDFGSQTAGAPKDYFLLDGSLFAGLDVLPDGTLAAGSFATFASPDDILASESSDARIFAVASASDLVRDDLLIPGTQITFSDHIDLYYDPTGGETSDAIQFASVIPGTLGLTLQASDFRITGIFGTGGEDTMIGTEGDDILSALAGDDVVGGGDGNDVLAGGSGTDALSGGAGNDILRGGDGDDYLNGGNGNDRLIGGPGGDELSGGAGDDRFIFDEQVGGLVSDIDTLTDFTSDGVETDLIVLSSQVFSAIQADALGQLGAGQVVTLDSPFNFGGTTTDACRLVYDPVNGGLYYDADGGTLDNAVQFADLSNRPAALSESNFLLA